MIETLIRNFLRWFGGIDRANWWKGPHIPTGTKRERTAYAGLGFSKKIAVYEEWDGNSWEQISEERYEVRPNTEKK